MAACAGTTRSGKECTMPAAGGSDYCYLHDPNPAIAERRKRNASRAATLGNSRVGAEIRSTRLLVRDLVEMTVANELHPLVRKRLTEVVQLLQVYSRLAELEINAGERPTSGEVALPEDTKEHIRGWAKGEETNIREKEELVGELSQAMRAHGRDPTPIRQAMGGDALFNGAGVEPSHPLTNRGILDGTYLVMRGNTIEPATGHPRP